MLFQVCSSYGISQVPLPVLLWLPTPLPHPQPVPPRGQLCPGSLHNWVLCSGCTVCRPSSPCRGEETLPGAKLCKSMDSKQACTMGLVSGSGGNFDNCIWQQMFFSYSVRIAQHGNLPIINCQNPHQYQKSNLLCMFEFSRNDTQNRGYQVISQNTSEHATGEP